MADGVSSNRLGLSFLNNDMIYFGSSPLAHAATQTPAPPSFTTPSPPFTASVASLSSTVIPQYARTISIRAEPLNSGVFALRSSTGSSAAVAIDAVLVAGSVSVLIGIGSLVGIVCYKKKKRGKEKHAIHVKGRKLRVQAKTDDVDVEASPMPLVQKLVSKSRGGELSMSTYDPTPYWIGTSIQPDSNRSPSLGSSTPGTVPSSSTPLLMRADQSPQQSPILSMSSPFSPIRRETPFDSPISSYTRSYSGLGISHRLESGELEEEDLGSVALSSLQTNDGYEAIESYDDDFPCLDSLPMTLMDSSSERKISLNACRNLTHFADAESFIEDVAFSQSQSTLGGSPISSSSGLQSLVTSTVDITGSPPYSIPPPLLIYTPHITSLSDPTEGTKSPPRLLELTLDSEVDLRSWLGLDTEDGVPRRTTTSEAMDTNIADMPAVPELVTTDSQETITGTDESFDGHVSAETSTSSPYCPPLLEDNEQLRESASLAKDVHHSKELELPPFEPAVTRNSGLYQIAASISTRLPIANFVPDNQTQSRTLAPSSSFASSSTSVTTLQLPSFCVPGLRPLTEEVLPPPSIIVSMPTDGSLVMPDMGAPDLFVGGSEAEQRTLGDSLRRGSATIARVKYDPVDEVEEEAWGDAYERTCFVEASDSICAARTEEAYADFAESWISSSESSELDIGKAIAKFPLPPNFPLESLEMPVNVVGWT